MERTLPQTGGRYGFQVMAQLRFRMTAIRRAKATIAILPPRRCANWVPHDLTHVDRPRFIMTVAAWHNARLRLTSPALVIPLDISLQLIGCVRVSGQNKGRLSLRIESEPDYRLLSGKSARRPHQCLAWSSNGGILLRLRRAGVPVSQWLPIPVVKLLWHGEFVLLRLPAWGYRSPTPVCGPRVCHAMLHRP